MEKVTIALVAVCGIGGMLSWRFGSPEGLVSAGFGIVMLGLLQLMLGGRRG